MKGIKHDSEKPRMELLPPHGVIEVAKVMTLGAKKYGDFNYMGGMDHGRLLGAALRHIFADIRGEDIDELGTLHLANAAASLMMLIEYRLQGIGADNRYKKPLTLTDIYTLRSEKADETTIEPVLDDNHIRPDMVRVVQRAEGRMRENQHQVRVCKCRRKTSELKGDDVSTPACE